MNSAAAGRKTSLPIHQPKRSPAPLRRKALHGIRVVLFLSVLLMIHWQAREVRSRRVDLDSILTTQQIQAFFPPGSTLSSKPQSDGSQQVTLGGAVIGYAVQTSPMADHLIGFSGPTNVLLAFNAEDAVVGVQIIASGDTREHIEQIESDSDFLHQLIGLQRSQVADTPYDVVSGATLTSLAIQESIVLRLSGRRASLRFGDPPTLDLAQRLFANADHLEQAPGLAGWWNVLDKERVLLGHLLRTSPHTDNIIGYQGPTELWLGCTPDESIVGLQVGKSFDNDPYVGYVRDERYYLKYFNDRSLRELADTDIDQERIEGVSGATMTSVAAAEGLFLAVQEHFKMREAASRKQQARSLRWSWRDLGTGLVVLAGIGIGFTHLRGNRWIRLVFQLVLIGYLGLLNGDMLSQAMLVGWAQSGVPWRTAGGLALLTLAALLIPIFSRNNVYCSHLCPHGALQQLLKNRLPWRLRLPVRAARILGCIPALLLLWCVTVALSPLTFSLVDIEPFDAWVFRVAGWATLTVAIVGLLASLFVPMAYCRFGCPTGTLLGFLRFHGGSEKWTIRDWFALVLVVLAAGLWRVF